MKNWRSWKIMECEELTTTLSLLCILFRSVSRLVCLDRSIPTLFLIASFVQNNILPSLVQNLSSSKIQEFLSLSFLFICFPRFILGSKIGNEMIHDIQMTFYWYIRIFFDIKLFVDGNLSVKHNFARKKCIL